MVVKNDMNQQMRITEDLHGAHFSHVIQRFKTFPAKKKETSNTNLLHEREKETAKRTNESLPEGKKRVRK